MIWTFLHTHTHTQLQELNIQKIYRYKQDSPGGTEKSHTKVVSRQVFESEQMTAAWERSYDMYRKFIAETGNRHGTTARFSFLGLGETTEVPQNKDPCGWWWGVMNHS